MGCRQEVPAGTLWDVALLCGASPEGVGLAVHLAPVPVHGGPASGGGCSLARKGELGQRNPCLRDLDFWNC